MKAIKTLAILILVALLTFLLTSFVSQPERYLSTWRYQLKCDIERGNEDALKYYEENYTSKGVYLFNEN